MLTRGLTNNSWLAQILYVIIYYILYSYNKASVFCKLLQISKHFSNILLKESAYKWTHTVQTCIVQATAVFETITNQESPRLKLWSIIVKTENSYSYIRAGFLKEWQTEVNKIIAWYQQFMLELLTKTKTENGYN